MASTAVVFLSGVGGFFRSETLTTGLVARGLPAGQPIHQDQSCELWGSNKEDAMYLRYVYGYDIPLGAPPCSRGRQICVNICVCMPIRIYTCTIYVRSNACTAIQCILMYLYMYAYVQMRDCHTHQKHRCSS